MHVILTGLGMHSGTQYLSAPSHVCVMVGRDMTWPLLPSDTSASRGSAWQVPGQIGKYVASGIAAMRYHILEKSTSCK